MAIFFSLKKVRKFKQDTWWRKKRGKSHLDNWAFISLSHKRKHPHAQPNSSCKSPYSNKETKILPPPPLEHRESQIRGRRCSDCGSSLVIIKHLEGDTEGESPGISAATRLQTCWVLGGEGGWWWRRRCRRCWKSSSRWVTEFNKPQTYFSLDPCHRQEGPSFHSANHLTDRRPTSFPWSKAAQVESGQLLLLLLVFAFYTRHHSLSLPPSFVIPPVSPLPAALWCNQKGQKKPNNKLKRWSITRQHAQQHL